jgi:phenylacetate-CoA ligase
MSWLYEEKIKRYPKPAILEKYYDRSGMTEASSLAGRPEFRADSMPVREIARYQDEAVRELIGHIYVHSPFYRAKMDAAGVKPDEINSAADLSRLPFTTKDELRGNPWLLLACDKKDIALVQVSTGTTGGEEIYILNTWRDYLLNEIAPGYPRLFTATYGDICLNALPYEMSSAGLSFHKVFMNSCDATVLPAGKGGAYSTPAKTVKMMQDLRPNVAMTTPSWSVSIYEAAAEAGFDISSLQLKEMWLTGEGCSNAFRERVEKMWGTVANFAYGSLECGGIGYECRNHNGYHLCQAHVVIEIIDPETGKVLEPGEIGEIVVTCLLRYDTPLLRYRTKDLGYIDTDTCSCGVELHRLFLRGRLVDQLEIQGISFSPYYLEEFLMRLPEVGNWYQFIEDPTGAGLKIRCELASGYSASEGLADALASRMEYGTGLPCKFEIVDQFPRVTSKAVRVVHET